MVPPWGFPRNLCTAVDGCISLTMCCAQNESIVSFVGRHTQLWGLWLCLRQLLSVEISRELADEKFVRFSKTVCDRARQLLITFLFYLFKLFTMFYFSMVHVYFMQQVLEGGQTSLVLYRLISYTSWGYSWDYCTFCVCIGCIY